MSKQPLAIFDIDGTIFRSSLAIELIYALVERGVFPGEARRALEMDYRNWVNRLGTYEKFVQRVVEVYYQWIQGCREGVVRQVAREVVEEHNQRVYRYTRMLIADLREVGYYLLAISGSPSEMVEIFQQYWQFDYAIGAVFEVEGGVYTGRALLEPARDKSSVLSAFLAEHPFSLKGSVGIGDTESDVGVLELVERAIAFNPNANLKAIAEERGWEMVVERKDVIWEF